MKICQLCAVDFTLHYFLLPLIDGMRRAGWEVVSVCADGHVVTELREHGYRIQTVPIARSLNPIRHLPTLLKLVRLFRRERFDVVHVHTPVAALLGRLAARIAGVPLVVYTAHGFYFHDDMPRLKRLIFVMLERLAGKWTDILFTQSEEDARTAVLEKIMPVERVFAIGNGVSVERFDPESVGDGIRQRDALGIPRNAFVIGMIGRLVKEKGVGEFLAAAQILALRFPEARFLLVGERLTSDHALGVEAEIAECQAVLGERLVLTGLRRDIPELLSAMDLFCLPSWREGMPRTVIEAMMMGKPVVATDIRGAREEIVNGETGLLVPVRSPEHLANAIGRYLTDKKLALRMGEAGRLRALKLYDEEEVVDLQVLRIAEYARMRGLLT